MQKRVFWAVLVAALATAACSRDSTGTVERQLTVVEAQAVATQLFYEVATGLAKARYTSGNAGVRMASLSSDAGPVSFTFDSACRLGGTVQGSGLTHTALSSAGNGSVTYVMTSTPQACVIAAGGRNMTIDGDPSINMNWSTAFADSRQSGNIDYAVTGALVWSDGSCKVDYHIVYTPQGSGKLTGTVCGRDVTQTF